MTTPAGLLVMTALFFGFPSALYAQVTVKGRIIFAGTPPPIEKVDVKSDVPTCGNIKEVQKIILGKDRGVANAVVTIVGVQTQKAGTGPAGDLSPNKGTLDQVTCEFVPHVQVLPVESTLILTSSDPVLHNSHGFYEDGSTAFNIAVPIMGMEVSQKLPQAGIIKLRCDAGHTWMSAYVVVTDAPYYALTDTDGNFSMEGVPPGDYEIEIWHEWFGTRRQTVKVGEGEKPLVIEVRKNGG